MKGFTLIETLVAVSILTFAVVGPMFTASRAIVAAKIANDQITASYLAQEGIEYMHAVRGDSFLKEYKKDPSTASGKFGKADKLGKGWDDFIATIMPCNATTIQSQACTLNIVGATPLTQCSTGSSGSCLPLRRTELSDGNYGYTQQSGGTVTPFTRTIQVIDTASPTDERIISTVSWRFHNVDYSVVISDHLTPWQ